MRRVSEPPPTEAREPIHWVCPEGHPEADDAAAGGRLPERVFCMRCDHQTGNGWHDRDDVTVLGRGEREAAYA
jgi:hypothetical protein